MAADKTFEIAIETSADTSGAQQAKISLEELQELSARLNERVAGTEFDKSGSSGEAAVRTQILDTERQITSQKNQQNAASEGAAQASVLEGENLENARRAAENLTRQLASGGDITRSLSSLFIALEPALGPAAVAAFGIYQSLKATSAVAETLGKLFGGFSIGDLASGLNPEALVNQITAAHELERTLAEIDKQSFQQLQAGLEKAEGKLGQLTDLYRQALVEDDGLLEPIFGKNEKIRTSILEQIKGLEEEVRIRQQATSVAEALAKLEESKTIELGRQKELLQRQIDDQRTATDLGRQFKEHQKDAFSDQEKLESYRTRVVEIRQDLEKLGVAANSPNAAYIKSIGIVDGPLRNSVLKLADEWQLVEGQENKAAQAITEQTKRLDEQIKGALSKKVEILTKLAALGAQGADKELQSLQNPADKQRDFFDRSANDPSLSETSRDNARRSRDQIDANKLQTELQEVDATLRNLQQEAATGIKAHGDSATAATKEIATTATQEATRTQSAIEALPAQITPLFSTTASAIETAIPQAIADGNRILVAAVVSAVGTIKSNHDRQITLLWEQVTRLWERPGAG